MTRDRQYLLRLQAQFTQADGQLALLRAAVPDRQLIHDQLRSYTLRRFLLEPEDCPSEELLQLSACSIQKAAELRRQGAEVQDISAACNGISSAAAKKVLLLLAIQKVLDIRFDQNAVPYIEDLWQLTDAVSALLGASL